MEAPAASWNICLLNTGLISKNDIDFYTLFMSGAFQLSSTSIKEDEYSVL